MIKLPRQALSVLAVPAFKDNYLWLVHDGVNAAVVDPGDSGPILAALAAHKLALTAILLTHHHADHTGVAHLPRAAPVPGFGPRREHVDGVSAALDDGDTLDAPSHALRLRVFDMPATCPTCPATPCATSHIYICARP